MMPLLVVLLQHGSMDLIYFWSSIVMVAFPITIFSVLTYLVVKGSRKEHGATEHGAGSTEQNTSR